MGSEGNGCCPLNCSHVYGYTTLMERLYPALAKDSAPAPTNLACTPPPGVERRWELPSPRGAVRLSDFVRNFDPSIGVTMRFGTSGFAIDGALASVIKTYLVVLQSDSQLSFLPQAALCNRRNR